MALTERWRRLRTSGRLLMGPGPPVGLGLLGGACLALAADSLERALSPGGSTPGGLSATASWAFLFGFVSTSAPLALLQFVARRMLRELRAHSNVRPLIGERLLATDPWAMDAVFAEHLVHELHRKGGQVVELGSGQSTVLIARCLHQARAGALTSIDHDAGFAERTRGWLREQGLEGRASVLHAPLKEQSLGGRRVTWYSTDALEDRLPEKIDLLVVDGPPGAVGRDSRWPAAEAMRHRLAPAAVVLMDDGDRADETRIAHDWQRRLGGRLRYLVGGRGAWRLELPA